MSWRVQPGASESRQPDLVLPAEWLGISLDIAEILRTLLWAGVVEIAEIAAFGFAGFFWPPREERTATLKAEQEAPGATLDAKNVPPPPREARQASKRDRRPKKADRENRGQCAHQGSQPLAKRCSVTRDGGEQRRSIDMFVAMLSHGPELRVAGSAFRDAYERVREQRG